MTEASRDLNGANGVLERTTSNCRKGFCRLLNSSLFSRETAHQKKRVSTRTNTVELSRRVMKWHYGHIGIRNRGDESHLTGQRLTGERLKRRFEGTLRWLSRERSCWNRGRSWTLSRMMRPLFANKLREQRAAVSRCSPTQRKCPKNSVEGVLLNVIAFALFVWPQLISGWIDTGRWGSDHHYTIGAFIKYSQRTIKDTSRVIVRLEIHITDTKWKSERVYAEISENFQNIRWNVTDNPLYHSYWQ